MRWGIRSLLLAAGLGLVLPGSAGAFGALSSFGSFGSGAGQLNAPRGVVVGPDGMAYVADLENHRVSVFAADGSFVQAMGKGVRPGGGDICTTASACKAGIISSSPPGLTAPVGVALGPEDRLFVSEANDNRVVVFAPNGTFKYIFGAPYLHEPQGIQFGPSGLLYVANRADNRVDVFTPGGAFVRGIGKEVKPGGGNVCTEETGCLTGSSGDHSAGAIIGPQDVAFGPGGEVIVTDRGNERIDVFAPDGSFLRAFGKEVNSGSGDPDVCITECQTGASGSANGAFAAPSGVAADGAGTVYVADPLNERISVSQIDGDFVEAFGVTPEPFGVALDCRGALFVSEVSSSFARVERFGEPGALSPSCVKPPEPELIIDQGAKLPSNKFHFAGLRRNRGNGFAVLLVRVPGPGKLKLSGRGFRRLLRTARQATTVKLPIKPKVRLRYFLKQHGKGRIRAVVTYTPTGGEPRTLEKVIVLRRHRG